MRTKASNRILNKANPAPLERPRFEDADTKWLFLGSKVMDELRVLARLARPTEKR